MSRVHIKITNLKYRYPTSKKDILRGISLEFSEGKVTTLLGPNGSGKSTLFKVLLKVLSPYEGSIYIDGTDLKDIDIDSLSRITAWVPQEEDSMFPYVVLDYILMGRTPHLGFFNIPSKKDREIAQNILLQLGLSNISYRKIPTLSGGERKIVSIARALVQESNTLILDEPTAHLDIGNKARLLNMIRKMANSGKTIIFSTHDPNEASLVADKVIILNGGEIVSEGPPAIVLTKDILEKIYSTYVIVKEINGRPFVVLT